MLQLDIMISEDESNSPNFNQLVSLLVFNNV